MRASQTLLATLRDAPNEAELISHQLMLRAGMIRRLSSGLYTWLPIGLKVLHKIEQIIREEMDRIGAQEVLMPAVHPAELWQETGRWEAFGGQLLKMNDSNGREYCFGPTHEEVITDLMRRELHSYKQLPMTFYQIQTKFRDEIRPRFGVMRAREFLMKDAYSFHLDEESLQVSYQAMYQAYCKIFDRIDLNYRAVEADTGAIGGSFSHEFQALADSGEDLIFFSDKSDYAANVEKATSLPPSKSNASSSKPIELVDTPNTKTVAEVALFLKSEPKHILKTLIVEGSETPFVALVLRGDDELNEIKASKHRLVKAPLTLAKDELILKQLKAPVGSLGPVGLKIPIVVDHTAAAMDSFICGANIEGKHYLNATWERDASYDEIFDLRNVKIGDPSPDGIGHLQECRGIEIGHVFQLGKKYTIQMKAEVLNEKGELEPMIMGTYGLGVSRIVAAVIEQCHDKNGIIWPQNIAPFRFVVIPINAHRSELVKEKAFTLYQQLLDLGYEVLLDDRNERPGVLFADADLIGIPHRFVISERHLEKNQIEYKARIQENSTQISFADIFDFIKTL